MEILIQLILGGLFGFFLCLARLNRFDTIAGLATLKDLTFAKTLLLTVGLGLPILLYGVYHSLIIYQARPLYTIGTALGGFLFGVGLAILGFFPSSMFAAMGRGAADAFIGFIGALFGSWIYALLFPTIELFQGDTVTVATLFDIMGGRMSVGLLFLFCLWALFLVFLAFALDRWEHQKGRSYSARWIISGIGLSIITIIMYYRNKDMDLSSYFPYLMDNITPGKEYPYFILVAEKGRQAMWFLAGSFVVALGYSLADRSFRIHTIHREWSVYRGENVVNRLIWAFIGGFILLFGTRLAEGCVTSHIMTGGMVMGMSSYLFIIAFLIGFFIVGKLFYTKRK